MKTSAVILVVIVVLVLLSGGLIAFAYSGIYNIGADAHHTRPVHALIEMLVDRSVEQRAKDITVPNLDNPQWVLAGAGQYASRCAECHLAPGLADSDLHKGLYPQPPQLAKFHPDTRFAFWAIKHGIKMSAMPAWGDSLDDATIWNIVAFLQKMPDLTPAQYQDLVAQAKTNTTQHP